VLNAVPLQAAALQVNDNSNVADAYFLVIHRYILKVRKMHTRACAKVQRQPTSACQLQLHQKFDKLLIAESYGSGMSRWNAAAEFACCRISTVAPDEDVKKYDGLSSCHAVHS
jgi:hypothetical protein